MKLTTAYVLIDNMDVRVQIFVSSVLIGEFLSVESPFVIPPGKLIIMISYIYHLIKIWFYSSVNTF